MLDDSRIKRKRSMQEFLTHSGAAYTLEQLPAGLCVYLFTSSSNFAAGSKSGFSFSAAS